MLQHVCSMVLSRAVCAMSHMQVRAEAHHSRVFELGTFRAAGGHGCDAGVSRQWEIFMTGRQLPELGGQLHLKLQCGKSHT